MTSPDEPLVLLALLLGPVLLAHLLERLLRHLLRGRRARAHRAALAGLSWHGRPYPHPRTRAAPGARLWLRLRYGVTIHRSPVVGGHVITSRRRLTPRASLEARRLTAAVLEAKSAGNRGQAGGA